jgi:hypothetical protein
MNFLSNKCIINLLLLALLPPNDLSLRIFNLIRHFTSGYIHRKISLISYMQHSSLFFNWLEKDQTRPYLFKDKNSHAFASIQSKRKNLVWLRNHPRELICLYIYIYIYIYIYNCQICTDIFLFLCAEILILSITKLTNAASPFFSSHGDFLFWVRIKYFQGYISLAIIFVGI